MLNSIAPFYFSAKSHPGYFASWRTQRKLEPVHLVGSGAPLIARLVPPWVNSALRGSWIVDFLRFLVRGWCGTERTAAHSPPAPKETPDGRALGGKRCGAYSSASMAARKSS